MPNWTVQRGFDASLLTELSALWIHEPMPNPFSSPSFLRVMSLRGEAAGVTPILALARSDEGALVAAWPLSLDRAGVLRFLQHAYSDQRSCMRRPEVTESELASGLAGVIRTVSPASVSLTNVPSWGPTLPAACEALHQIGWRYHAFRAWACPILSVARGPAAGEALRNEINRHKRVRGYANSLARNGGFTLEVLEDATDLEAWCREFCDTHERRWNTTRTPSQYRFVRARSLFQKVLDAWACDGVLIRFAIRLASGRAAFVAALRADRRLIYQHVVTSPAVERFRAGHVLIRLVGLWMSERDFDTLDFGTGGEEYKGRYANGDEPLWRVYAGRRAISVSYLRGSLEARIRGSSLLQQLWDSCANKFVRGTLSQWIGDQQTRQRIVRTVPWRSYGRILVRRLRERLAGKREILYRASGRPGSCDPSVIELRAFDVLRMLEAERGLFRWERVALYEACNEGARLVGIAENGSVLLSCRLMRVDPTSLPKRALNDARAAWRISGRVASDCARGRALYPRTLKGILGLLPSEDIAIVHAEEWDTESQRDIVQAGFERFAVMVTAPGSRKEILELSPAEPQLPVGITASS